MIPTSAYPDAKRTSPVVIRGNSIGDVYVAGGSSPNVSMKKGPHLALYPIRIFSGGGSHIQDGQVKLPVLIRFSRAGGFLRLGFIHVSEASEIPIFLSFLSSCMRSLLSQIVDYAPIIASCRENRGEARKRFSVSPKQVRSPLISPLSRRAGANRPFRSPWSVRHG